MGFHSRYRYHTHTSEPLVAALVIRIFTARDVERSQVVLLSEQRERHRTISVYTQMRRAYRNANLVGATS